MSSVATEEEEVFSYRLEGSEEVVPRFGHHYRARVKPVLHPTREPFPFPTLRSNERTAVTAR